MKVKIKPFYNLLEQSRASAWYRTCHNMTFEVESLKECFKGIYAYPVKDDQDSNGHHRYISQEDCEVVEPVYPCFTTNHLVTTSQLVYELEEKLANKIYYRVAARLGSLFSNVFKENV